MGALFSCQREEGNSEDPYTVAVISDGNVYIVGNIPRLMSAGIVGWIYRTKIDPISILLFFE